MTVDTSVLYSGLWFQDDQILCEKMSHRQHLVAWLSQQVFLLPWDVMIFFSMWEKEILQLSDEGMQNIISPRIRTAHNKTEHCLLCNKASEIQNLSMTCHSLSYFIFFFALSCCYYFGFRSWCHTHTLKMDQNVLIVFPQYSNFDISETIHAIWTVLNINICLVHEKM